VTAVVILAVAWGLAFLLASLALTPAPDLWLVLFPAVFELLFLVPVWWFSGHKYSASLRDLGFVRFKGSALGIGVALLIGIYVVNAVYSVVLAQYGLQPQSDMSPVFEALPSPWPLFFVIVIVAPIAEEIFFRGFVFTGLRSRFGWGAAAAISAAMFAVFHLELTFFIPAFLLGFLFAYVYHRSNSIWPGIILHVIFNSIGVAAYYFVPE
jgi:membrane protease YdiL (CAAX protease family)